MASSRALGALGSAVGLTACGVAGALALVHGFYATLFLAALAAAWLTALGWWSALVPSAYGEAPPGVGDVEGDRAMLRALLDQAPTPMLAVEDGARVRALNRAARQLFATDDLLLPPPSGLIAADRSHLHHAERNWRIDRVAAQGLGPARTILALIDVEPEERAAEARAVRELLRLLGHEVMNSLSPIASLAESALAASAVPERREGLLPEILGTLARRAEGLQRFADAYRQLARLPTPTIRSTPLAPILDDLARLFAAEWDGRVALKVRPCTAATATIDRDQIMQALWALLQNAAEAALAVPSPGVHLRCAQDAGATVFDIVDNGDGIPDPQRSTIFDAFVTTKPSGSGIGLYVARLIARAHGGDVHLLAGPNTTFRLSVRAPATA